VSFDKTRSCSDDIGIGGVGYGSVGGLCSVLESVNHVTNLNKATNRLSYVDPNALIYQSTVGF